MIKKALIFGVTGQDGSYLADFLLKKKYAVHGIVRRVALEDKSHRLWRLRHVLNKITLHPGSLESYASLVKLIQKIKPDEVYHLGAQSYVDYSFKDEFSTLNTNMNGTHYILSALKEFLPSARFYFAGSSEMFGKVREVPQTEKTPFYPRSVYGISKVAGYDLTRNYREAYNMYCCSGILFNHESPRRGFEFVTRKITHAVARIKFGIQKDLKLGNIDAKRDWGHAEDFVEGMQLALNADQPQEYILATGKTNTIRQFVDKVLTYLSIPAYWKGDDCCDKRNNKLIVTTDKAYRRPAEADQLVGDSTKAKTELGWVRKYDIDGLIADMVETDLRRYSKS